MVSAATSATFIKRARKKLGLTQSELAEKLNLNRPQIAQYETRTAMPSGDTILKLQRLVKEINKNEAK